MIRLLFLQPMLNLNIFNLINIIIIIIVLEARNVIGLKNPNIRLKMGSQKFQAPALDTRNEILKWDAKTKL